MKKIAWDKVKHRRYAGEIAEWSEEERELAAAAVFLHRALVPFLLGDIGNIKWADFFGYAIARGLLLNEARLNIPQIARVINTAITVERLGLLP
jgi:hypothetical protein